MLAIEIVRPTMSAISPKNGKKPPLQTSLEVKRSVVHFIEIIGNCSELTLDFTDSGIFAFIVFTLVK